MDTVGGYLLDIIYASDNPTRVTLDWFLVPLRTVLGVIHLILLLT